MSLSLKPPARVASGRPSADDIGDCVADVLQRAPKSGPYVFVAAVVEADLRTGEAETAIGMAPFSILHAIALAVSLLAKTAERIAESPEHARLYAQVTTSLAALGAQDRE